MSTKSTPGLLATAAVGALVLSVPGIATAATVPAAPPPVAGTADIADIADMPSSWGSVSSANGLAEASGTIMVRASTDGDTDARAAVILRDLDNSAETRRRCARVVFQALATTTGRWSTAYTATACGDVARTFGFEVTRVKGMRVRACQSDGRVAQHCGGWKTLYDLDRLDSPEAEMADEVVRLTNEARAAAGCEPLTPDPRLRDAAVSHSDDMAARNYFGHTSPDGLGPGQRLEAAGFTPPAAWSENIARGRGTAAEVVKKWMASPGHKANILNCGYAYVGVGYTRQRWTLLMASR
ncbi:CAP domain-containing protein [Nonomuraea sp. NPDC003804]|uniref:CAP domain-containing protein n=1 Tax=Nonomuraea sp. NPDC003804 TaxID=3154547 RepID=UPI0033A1B644